MDILISLESSLCISLCCCCCSAHLTIGKRIEIILSHIGQSNIIVCNPVTCAVVLQELDGQSLFVCKLNINFIIALSTDFCLLCIGAKEQTRTSSTTIVLFNVLCIGSNLIYACGENDGIAGQRTRTESNTILPTLNEVCVVEVAVVCHATSIDGSPTIEVVQLEVGISDKAGQVNISILTDSRNNLIVLCVVCSSSLGCLSSSIEVSYGCFVSRDGCR